jgi:hypothetical protein
MTLCRESVRTITTWANRNNVNRLDGWTAMTSTDVIAANRLSDRLHPNYPEKHAVFVDRWTLFPQGALALHVDGTFHGYCISHPMQHDTVVPLNMLFRHLPTEQNTLYIHDIGLNCEARGRHWLRGLFSHLETIARRHELPTLSGVAINGTFRLWRRFGFKPFTQQDHTKRHYGPDAIHVVRPIGRGHVSAHPTLAPTAQIRTIP